jgi:hypothetical protein
MDDITAARRIAERLRPGIERGNMRSHAEAERTLRYGRARILLGKVEKISSILGDGLASSLQFEADLERLRADKARLGGAH